jgi:hypothetical protein
VSVLAVNVSSATKYSAVVDARLRRTVGVEWIGLFVAVITFAAVSKSVRARTADRRRRRIDAGLHVRHARRRAEHSDRASLTVPIASREVQPYRRQPSVVVSAMLFVRFEVEVEPVVFAHVPAAAFAALVETWNVLASIGVAQ